VEKTIMHSWENSEDREKVNRKDKNSVSSTKKRLSPETVSDSNTTQRVIYAELELNR